jgi:hypothetical protein
VCKMLRQDIPDVTHHARPIFSAGSRVGYEPRSAPAPAVHVLAYPNLKLNSGL